MPLRGPRLYSFRTLRSAAVILIVLLVAAMGYSIWKLRSDAIEDAYKDTGNLATVLASQVGEIVRSVDDILNDIESRLQQQDIETEENFRRVMATEFGHTLLKARADRFPLAEVITLLDLEGDALATSVQWPPRKLNLSDRDYFQSAKNSTSRELFVSEPAERRLVGTPSVFFAKRIQSYTGRPLGVISIGAPISGLRNIYSSIQLLGDWSFTLARTDGTILARFPEGNFTLGQRLPRSSPWFAAVEKGGRFRSDSGLLPGMRLVSVRKVADYPLIVSMGVNQAQSLEAWWHRATIIGAGTLLATICSVFLLAGMSKRVRLLKTSELSLGEQKEQLAAKSAELEITKAQAEAAVHHITQGITMFDADERLILCNARFLELYRLSPQLIRPGITFQEVFENRKSLGNHVATSPGALGANRARVLGGRRVERNVHLADGRVISIVSNPMPTGGWVTTHEDITERHAAAARIAHMATHDSLTGLPNRAAFDQRIAEATADLNVRETPFAILLFDLDFFKGINDTHGHQAGDELLKYVAARAQSCIEPNDMLARLGGDEFVCLLPCTENPEQRARTIANKIMDVIEPDFSIGGERLMIGVSMGIALAPRDGTDADTLMKNADVALYRAKEQGRNRFRFFSAASDERLAGARGRRAG